MSLINEALKKAQHMRAAETSATAPGPSENHSHRRLKQGLTAKSLISLVAGATILVIGSVFATVYFLRKPVSSITFQSEDRVMKAEPVASLPKSVDAQATQVEAHSTKEVNTPVLGKTKPSEPAEDNSPNLYLPPAVAAAVKPADTKSVQTSEVKAPELPRIELPNESTRSPVVSSTAKQPAVLKTLNEPKPQPEYQTLVNKFKIIGIRAAKGEGKVLMNDRVFRLNDIVDTGSGLKLVEVSNERLIFEDPQGNRYIRNF